MISKILFRIMRNSSYTFKGVLNVQRSNFFRWNSRMQQVMMMRRIVLKAILFRIR